MQLEDALKLVIERSRLLQAFLPDQKMAEMFAETTRGITYAQPKVPLISSVNGETQEVGTPEYWENNLSQSDEFTVNSDLANYQVFLSLGSQTALPTSEGIHLSSLRQGNDWREMLHSLGELIVRGAVINWDNFYQNHQNYHHCLQLPTYPFQRQRYWFKTSEDKSQAETELRDKTEEKLFSLLHQGEIQQLTNLLEKTGEFSEEQIELLPEMLEILAKHHQEQVNATVEKVS